MVKADLAYSDNAILDVIVRNSPALIAIDAPFSLPARGLLRTADKKMIRRGYCVFPPTLTAMKKLTLRAMRLNKLIGEKGYTAIEVHPTSTRRALGMPLKAWGEIQDILIDMRLEGDVKTRTLTSHELDAVIAALTAHLHIHNKTEMLGDETEGYIIVPRKQDWRTIKI